MESRDEQALYAHQKAQAEAMMNVWPDQTIGRISDPERRHFAKTARAQNRRHQRTDFLIGAGIVASVWIWFVAGVVALVDLALIVWGRLTA